MPVINSFPKEANLSKTYVSFEEEYRNPVNILDDLFFISASLTEGTEFHLAIPRAYPFFDRSVITITSRHHARGRVNMHQSVNVVVQEFTVHPENSYSYDVPHNVKADQGQ